MRYTPCWIAAAVILAALLAATAGARERRPGFAEEELEPLLQSLQDEGLPRPVLNEIFYDDRLRKVRGVVSLNGVNRDSGERYRQFYTDYAIGRAKRFKRRHWQTLERAERRYGVPKEIIVAVLLVETQFGTYPLRYRVLEVFTTLVVEANYDAIQRHYRRVKRRYPDVERAWFADRVSSKAAWAYEELVALLAMRHEEPDAVYEIKGSYAGAFGMPQFLPSSYLRWGTDGNGDGRVDLDHSGDAIASIANYLRQHGWRSGAPLERKMQAVWEYNHSPHYVDAIFKISRRMRLPPDKTPASSSSAAKSQASGPTG